MTREQVNESTPIHDALVADTSGTDRILAAVEAQPEPRSPLADWVAGNRLGVAVAVMIAVVVLVALVVEGGWM